MGAEAVGLRRSAALLALLVFLPTAAGQSQSLSDRLGELHFPEIVVTVAPKAVTIDASDAALGGTSASDLRKCIDDSNCPDDRLRPASNGDGDGQVEEDETDHFEAEAVSGLNLALAFGGGGGFSDFAQALRAIATIDGHSARGAKVDDFQIEDAEGSIGSTGTIRVSFRLIVDFPDVGDANRHAVSIARAESGLELADRVVVRAASGWKIQDDTIQPARLQGYFGDGQIAGSQRELEGPEPLTFDLQRQGGLSGWGWFFVVSLFLLLLGAGIYLWRRQRRKV